jgi:hypothetical protein
MTSKTIRSRFDHEIGEMVEGCTILEKKIIIPPNPTERRLGVYEYLVEVQPVKIEPQKARKTTTPPVSDSFTRSTPDERGAVIRRVR